MKISDAGFVDWLDRQTYAERLQLKAWYSLRDNPNLSYEAFLLEHYEEVGSNG